MDDVIVINSAGRRVAEVASYLWRLFGMAYLLISAHVASGYSTTPSSTQVVRVLTLHAPIWIGESVFIVFFAQFSSLREVQKPRGAA